MRFSVGDAVAWSHSVPVLFPPGVELQPEVVSSLDRRAQFGHVTAIGNEAGTHLVVKLADGEERTLTHDELVLVTEGAN